MALKLFGKDPASDERKEGVSTPESGREGKEEIDSFEKTRGIAFEASKEEARELGARTLPMPIGALMQALKAYQMRPAEGVFSFDALPMPESGAGEVGYEAFLKSAKVSWALTGCRLQLLS